MLCKLPANTKRKIRSSFYAFKSCEIDHLIISVLCVKKGLYGLAMAKWHQLRSM
jgi:hypothetical protein